MLSRSGAAVSRGGEEEADVDIDVDVADVLDAVCGAAARELDRFDRARLREVLAVCRASRSLSEAGRALFAESSKKKTSVNDDPRPPSTTSAPSHVRRLRRTVWLFGSSRDRALGAGPRHEELRLVKADEGAAQRRGDGPQPGVEGLFGREANE